jgi:hypothetical protein
MWWISHSGLFMHRDESSGNIEVPRLRATLAVITKTKISGHAGNRTAGIHSLLGSFIGCSVISFLYALATVKEEDCDSHAEHLLVLFK